MLRNEIKSECHSMRPIDNLALEGGGAKGYFHMGAFLALYQLGLLQKIKRIAGTSIGAYLGTKIALGFSPDELINQSLKDFRQDKLLDFLDFVPNNSDTHYHSNPSEFIFQRFFKNIYNVSKSFIDVFHQTGLFYGKYIEDDLIANIQEKFPDKTNLTFLELHELRLKYPSLNLKDLYITAANITDNCLTVFSYETTPEMPIPTAVRCSMAVPGVFKPVSYQGKLYYDGGLKCNLPIRLFDHERYLEKGCLTVNKMNMRTLGISLSSPRRAYKMRDNFLCEKNNLTGMCNSVLGLLLLPVILQDMGHKNSHNPLRTIFLETQDITIFNFQLSREQIAKAIIKANEQTFTYAENYIKNTPDPNAETLESKLNNFKIILRFYSLFVPQHKDICLKAMTFFRNQLKEKKSNDQVSLVTKSHLFNKQLAR